jgi:hypothetical protein
MRLVRGRLARAVALLSIGLLASACTVVVGGQAQPAPSPTPRSVSGQTIRHVLLGDIALSQILKQTLHIDPRFPPRFGGPEALQKDGSTSSVDCQSVAVMLQQSAYQSTNVEHVAVETWRHATMSVKVIRVAEGVVSLPSAADADALFAKFSRQWQKCDGASVPLPGNVFRLTGKVANVQIATSVLAATISVGWTLPGSDSEAIPEGRAIGVRDNCLVEVEVDFFGTSNPSHQGSGDVNTSAVDIARAMLDKVSALS